MDARKPTPRADFWSALFFIVVGAAIGVGAWRMDRLETQHINPYTAPGLVPGILGVLIVLFGALILVRALQEGAPRGGSGDAPLFPDVKRTLVVLTLCLGFALGSSVADCRSGSPPRCFSSSRSRICSTRSDAPRALCEEACCSRLRSRSA